MSRTLREAMEAIHKVAAEIGREDGIENSPSMQFIATTSEIALLADEYVEGTAAESLARRFHETYERLAPSFGYETRKDSAVPWDQVPENNRALMIAVCAEVLGKVEKLRQIAQALVDHGRPGYNCPSDTYDEWADEHERLSNEIENELGRRAR